MRSRRAALLILFSFATLLFLAPSRGRATGNGPAGSSGAPSVASIAASCIPPTPPPNGISPCGCPDDGHVDEDLRPSESAVAPREVGVGSGEIRQQCREFFWLAFSGTCPCAADLERCGLPNSSGGARFLRRDPPDLSDGREFGCYY